MQFKDLTKKQVINVYDGSFIGLVDDIVFDPISYEILGLYVKPNSSFFKRLCPWLFSETKIELTRKEIEYIQGDVILVKIK